MLTIIAIQKKEKSANQNMKAELKRAKDLIKHPNRIDLIRLSRANRL